MLTVSRAHQKQRTYRALLTVFVVLLVCWGQQFSLSSACPQAAQQSLLSAADVTSDTLPQLQSEPCEMTSQMLTQQPVLLNLGLSALLLFLLLLDWLSTLKPVTRYTTPTLAPPRRRHLLLCTFLE